MTKGPVTGRDVRVALVGCGRIAGNHFDALRNVDGLSLVAVSDTNEQRARAAGEAQGVPWFRSYEEMLKSVKSDAIAICTPSGLHPQHGVLAARARSSLVSLTATSERPSIFRKASK